MNDFDHWTIAYQQLGGTVSISQLVVALADMHATSNAPASPKKSDPLPWKNVPFAGVHSTHLSSVLRLQLVWRGRHLARVHRTKSAATSTSVPQKHHSGGAHRPVPTLSDVWTLRFLAHRCQLQVLQLVLHQLVLLALRSSLPAVDVALTVCSNNAHYTDCRLQLEHS
jgi:hypothetical protein